MTQGNAGTFPALTFDVDDMYVFTDSVFTYDTSSSGTTYPIREFELVIDNMVNPRFTNSTTATDIASEDRRVTLQVSCPFTSGETALYDAGIADDTTATKNGTLVLTNPVSSSALTFAFADLKMNPARTPTVNGRGEIWLPIEYNAYKSSTTNELIVTHVP